MPDYMGIVRIKPGDSSNKILFVAQDWRAALLNLAIGADVNGTADIYEYELFEIIDNGKAYKLIGRKCGPKSTFLGEAGVKCIPKAAITTEGVYKPYGIQQAT